MIIKILKACYVYLCKHRICLMIYVLLSIIISLMTLYIPQITAQVFDTILYGSDIDEIYIILSILFTLNILIMVSQFITNMIYSLISVKMANEFIYNIIKHLHHSVYSQLSKYDPNYLAHRINGDCNTIIIFSLSFFQNLIINFLSLLYPLYYLLKLDYCYFLICILSFILYSIYYKIVKGKLYRVNKDLQECKNRYFASTIEQFINAKFLKINVLSKRYLNEFISSFNKLYLNNKKYSTFSNIFTSVDNLISTCARTLLLSIGAWNVLDGEITIGVLTILTSYFSTIMSTTSYFFGLSKSVMECKVCYDRINELMKIPLENNFGCKVKEIDKIVIDNLHFAYNHDIIFDKFNLILEKGNIYCICGRNGVGKSTFIDIITGLYNDTYIGEINIDNINIKKLDIEYFRENSISYLDQSYTNAKNSIAYSSKIDTTDKLIVQFIGEKLLREYDERNIDEHSGGEKQKLAILNTISKKADLYIFDEPTSNLDQHSSNLFIDILKALEDCICIIISHDSKIINESDYVIKLGDD